VSKLQSPFCFSTVGGMVRERGKGKVSALLSVPPKPGEGGKNFFVHGKENGTGGEKRGGSKDVLTLKRESVF